MTAINNGTELRALSVYDQELFNVYFGHSVPLQLWQQPHYLHFAHIMAQPYLVLWQIIDHTLCIFGRTESDFFLFAPPLASYSLDNELEECFKIIEREGFEPKMVHDYEMFWNRVDPANYKQEMTKICHITDLDAVLELQDEKYKRLHKTVKKFKNDNTFSYKMYQPKFNTAEATKFIQDNITQIPDKISAQYVENLLANSTKFYSQTTRILMIDGERMAAINIGCRLNKDTAAHLVNICDPSIENIIPYTRWRMHQDMKRFGCRFMNIGSNCDDADLNSLWEMLSPIGTIKLHSWKRGNIDPFIDMSGTK